MAKLTIVTVLYNSAKTIDDLMESLIPFMEVIDQVIAVDNCSTDASVLKFKSYETGFTSKLEVIALDKNYLQGYARNRSLDYVTSEYILFIDSDDFLMPNANVNELLKILDNSGADFAHCQWQYYENNQFVLKKRDQIGSNYFLTNAQCEQLLSNEIWFSVPRIYKTQFLKANEIKYSEAIFYEDFEFYLKACLRATLVYVSSVPFYGVRRSALSTTQTAHDTNKHLLSYIEAIKICDQFQADYRSASGKYFANRYLLMKGLYYFRTRATSQDLQLGYEAMIKYLDFSKAPKNLDFNVKQKVINCLFFNNKKPRVKELAQKNKLLGLITKIKS